jgi:hypothetical protein
MSKEAAAGGAGGVKKRGLLSLLRRLGIHTSNRVHPPNIDNHNHAKHVDFASLANVVKASQFYLQNLKKFFPALDREFGDPVELALTYDYKTDCINRGYQVFGRINKGAFGQVWLAITLSEFLQQNDKIRTHVLNTGHYLVSRVWTYPLSLLVINVRDMESENWKVKVES